MAAAVLFSAGCFTMVSAAGAQQLTPAAPARAAAGVDELIRAGAADVEAVGATNIMLAHGFSEEQIIAAQQIILEALAEDVPAGPLVGKIREGVSKNISPNVILLVLQSVKERWLFALHQGKLVAGGRSEGNSLGAVYAAALTAGLTRDDAEAITAAIINATAKLDARDTLSISMAAVKTARDMSRLGVDSSTLTEVVTGALANAFTADNLESLRRSFMEKSRHTPPDRLVQDFVKAVNQGKGQGRGSQGGSRVHGAGSHGGGTGAAGGAPGSGSGGGSGAGGASGGGGSGGGGSGGAGSGPGGSGGGGR